MHDAGAWFVDAKLVWIVLAAWSAAVLVHGLWRSRGEAPTDPIRESGPIL